MPRCPDLSYRVLAAKYLRKQVKQLTEHLGGVRSGEDIESVHHARVASRRLRACLGMFRDCWKRKWVKRWKKQIRLLAQDLGEARDRDVQIEFLTATLAGTPEGTLVPGIVRLLGQVESEREYVQPKVLKAIDRMEHSGVLDEIQSAAKRILAEPEAAAVAASDHCRQQLARVIRKELGKVLAEESGLDDPEQRERHHAMRIAAKHLRYTLEIARPAFDKDLVEIIDTTKGLQTQLGEIHDCDVWLEGLDDFSRREASRIQVHFGPSRRFERLQPGIDHLRAQWRQRRQQVFAELVACWHELKERGFWDRLNAIVEWGGGDSERADSATAAASA